MHYYYAPMEAAPAQVQPDVNVPAVPPPPAQGASTAADGYLAVNVPADAKVFVNGQATTSTGESRQYVSRSLSEGASYTYEVRAELVRNGKVEQVTKTVDVRAGQTSQLAFDFEAAPAVETALTVRVPAGAKVYLAGNPTNGSGDVRVFRTTSLSEGKAWKGYTVKVEYTRDGKTVTSEKVIDLAAGETKEIAFDDAEETAKIASNR